MVAGGGAAASARGPAGGGLGMLGVWVFGEASSAVGPLAEPASVCGRSDAPESVVRVSPFPISGGGCAAEPLRSGSTAGPPSPSELVRHDNVSSVAPTSAQWSRYRPRPSATFSPWVRWNLFRNGHRRDERARAREPAYISLRLGWGARAALAHRSIDSDDGGPRVVAASRRCPRKGERWRKRAAAVVGEAPPVWLRLWRSFFW